MDTFPGLQADCERVIAAARRLIGAAETCIADCHAGSVVGIRIQVVEMATISSEINETCEANGYTTDHLVPEGEEAGA